MALPIYLAMTASEYARCPSLPENPGWMACHFSSYGTGLSNIPDQFPVGGILMVNDRIPPACHSSQLIVQQLLQAVEKLSPRAIVLDFQRPYEPALGQIADHILDALPCPVVLTEAYCRNPKGGILLSPVPPHKNLRGHLQRWQGRDIWLELSKAGQLLVLTKDGCRMQPMPEIPQDISFCDEGLFCHYSTKIADDRADFSVWRTDEDLRLLLESAEKLGVTAAIGLYQEFC